MSLWRLELLRLFRTGRWIALAAVFVGLGVGNPLTTRYLGELLRGTTGAGYIQIIVSDPRPADAMVSYFSNIPSLGLLVVVVVAGLALAVRANQPLASVYLTHISAPKLLVPRLVTVALATIVAAMLGGLVAAYTTTVLLGAPALGSSVAGVSVSALGGVFAVAVTFLCASLLRGQVATIATALVTLFLVVPLLDFIPGVRRLSPNTVINLPATLQATSWNGSHTGAAVATTVLALACVVFGLWRSTRWEL